MKKNKLERTLKQNITLEKLCKKLRKEKDEIMREVYLNEFQFVLRRYLGSREEYNSYESKYWLFKDDRRK